MPWSSWEIVVMHLLGNLSTRVAARNRFLKHGCGHWNFCVLTLQCAGEKKESLDLEHK